MVRDLFFFFLGAFTGIVACLVVRYLERQALQDC